MSSRFTPEDLGKMLGKGNVSISADSGVKAGTNAPEGGTPTPKSGTKSRAEAKRQSPLETTETAEVVNYSNTRFIEKEGRTLRRTLIGIPNAPRARSGESSAAHHYRVKQLRAEGMRDGACDLFFMLSRCGFDFLCIEMKRSTEYYNTARSQQTAITDNQYEFADDAQACGGLYWACFGARHAIEVIERYLSGTLGQQSMILDYIKRHEGKR